MVPISGDECERSEPRCGWLARSRPGPATALRAVPGTGATRPTHNGSRRAHRPAGEKWGHGGERVVTGPLSPVPPRPSSEAAERPLGNYANNFSAPTKPQ